MPDLVLVSTDAEPIAEPSPGRSMVCLALDGLHALLDNYIEAADGDPLLTTWAHKVKWSAANLHIDAMRELAKPAVRYAQHAAVGLTDAAGTGTA